MLAQVRHTDDTPLTEWLPEQEAQAWAQRYLECRPERRFRLLVVLAAPRGGKGGA